MLHVGDLAAAAIGDAGLGDLRGIDRVVALDIFRAHDAGDDQLADFEVDADLLLALDHEIAVRQHLRHHGGNVGLQRFLAVDRTLAVAGGGGVGGQDPARQHFLRLRAERLGADEIGNAGVFLVGAAALGFVGDVGLVGNVDGHGHDVADARGALVAEEGAAAVPPQRVGVVGSLLRLRHRHLHRLVAGLRGRILDLGQLRLFADLGETVDRGATACERCHSQQGAGENEAVDTGN